MSPSRTGFKASSRTLRRRGLAPCVTAATAIAATIITTTTTGTTGVVRVLVRG